MNKILFIILSLFIVSGCRNTNCIKSQTKVSYLKVGLKYGNEIYMRVEGSSKFKIRFEDLSQMEYENCNSNYTVLARDVSYFSVITEEEYNKRIGINHTLETITTNIDSNITY